MLCLYNVECGNIMLSSPPVLPPVGDEDTDVNAFYLYVLSDMVLLSDDPAV